MAAQNPDGEMCSFHKLLTPRILCINSFLKVFFHVTHQGLSEVRIVYSLFLVSTWATFSKYNPQRVRNNMAHGNICCCFLEGGRALGNIACNAHGHNRKIWPQLLSNHSVCYIVHPLALHKHYIIILSVL